MASENHDDHMDNDLTLSAVSELWELTDTEQSQLVDLQQRVDNVVSDRNRLSELVRFLRARPNNVDAAETMFRTMVKWRLDHNVDRIRETYEPPADLQRYYPGAILEGVDREGDPIFVSRIGATDGIGLLNKYGRDEMIRHAIWLREMVVSRLQQFERKRGRPIRRICLIEDLEGLSMATHASRAMLSVYGEIMRLDQDNYPETAKKLIIIRAPALFRMIWSMAKHFFDPGVVQKMEFCGPQNYEQMLAQYMDLQVLPKEIVALGQGKASPGMPPFFYGGKIPKNS